MKTLILSTAFVAALTAPVLANNVADAVFVQEAVANQELFIVDGNQSGGNTAANSIFVAELNADDESVVVTEGNEILSTQNYGMVDAAAVIFAAED